MIRKNTNSKINQCFATDIIVDENLTDRQFANLVLRCLTNLQNCDNGTVRNPSELASVRMPDGRTFIQTVYEDRQIYYNDEYYVIDIDVNFIYVDICAKYIEDYDKYVCCTNVEDY